MTSANVERSYAGKIRFTAPSTLLAMNVAFGAGLRDRRDVTYDPVNTPELSAGHT